MKIRQFICATAAILLGILSSCSVEKAPDYDGGYGYVQFKLYKEASYGPDVKAIQSQLNYLGDACKVRVTMLYEDETLSQTLVLQHTGKEEAEYGLRSEKLKLYKGKYTLVNFTLYDALDQELYVGIPVQPEFEIVRGGLVMCDLTANVVARGKVRFTFTKDMSGFTSTPQTKARSRQYTFDEIRYIDLTVADKVTGERFSWDKLKTTFSIDFESEGSSHQTSVLTTAEDIEIKAGDFKVVSYNTYTSEKILLERNTAPAASEFKVKDNARTEAKVAVTLYEADEYIKDYYALYEIWKSLDGPNWYFTGQDFNRGSNWNFDKDPDLWGDQPGVELYSNGRVALLNLEGYNFKGALPAAIGQLDQLDQLYLGNHSDVSFLPTDPSEDPALSRASLFHRHKARMESLHMPTPMSEPSARALLENGIVTPETAFYKTMNESDLIEMGTGDTKRSAKLMDNIHGVYSNGLTSIDPAIGRLRNLEYLYIANSTLPSLPDEIRNLVSLTDFEIYNCPKMTQFPMVICELPELISVNLSNNSQWSSEEIYKGVRGLATGKSAGKIQILYLNQNNLVELPEEIRNFKALGLFDCMSNKLRKVPAFGHDINLVDCFLDNNQLEELGRDETGFFCGVEDVETFSATYNRFRKLPDIFSAKSTYTMGTVDFSYNQIDGVEHGEEGTYKGIKVATLTLANNNLKSFPVEFAKTESQVAYFNMRACGMENIPKEAFEDPCMMNTTSIDLSYNHLTSLPNATFNGTYLPYLYGVDLSYNRFSAFPYAPLDSAYLTVFAIRGQRDANGNRCLREWPNGIYSHKGLRGLYLGSNDLRKINDTISPLCYYLDISDNPNITFDATDICSAWMAGAYILIYDKTQNIVNCDYMLM